MQGRQDEPNRRDVYERVTARIIADLEQGVRTWLRPWNAGHAAGRITKPLRGNGMPYRGINIIMLWAAAMEQGFAAPIWLTFRQALDLGAHVRKGEKGSLVVYADRIRKTETDQESGEELQREIPFLKGYTVFNVEQIDGLPPHFHAPAAPVVDPVQRIDGTERFFAALGADIRHGGNRACYAIEPDQVRMPPFATFRDAESYYAVLGHECVHWTRHPARLDRDLGRKRHGDEGYAREELVAELGAAFLAADLGLELEPRPDHAAYLASWLQVVQGDKRAIFSAAAQAQRAVDFLHDRQGHTADPAAAALAVAA
jgi:antirestriction protein ArdC